MNSRVLQSLKVVLPLTIAGFVAFADNSPVSAQLTPDNTLGAENSIVTPQQLRDLIQGGAIRGNSLFHSFEEFNVGSDRGVFFDLQNNTNILNILTRVTGTNSSSILGTLGVLQDALNSNVLGNANLFLLNPNGITFGANANLQLNGSFFATTADGFGFDNFTFSASGEEAPPPLLTISIPRFASFRDNPGNIAVNQSNLTVNQGQSLSLVGGNVSVVGSGDITNLQGSLTANGGRIELGGLTAAGTVNINPDLSLVFPDGVARGNVSLTDAATLSVVSDTIGFDGGSVALTGQNLFITGDSAVLAGIGAGFGGEGVTAGDIDLNATGGITISDSTTSLLAEGALTQARGVQNRLNEGATGTGGDVNVTANSFNIANGGFISISTFGFGDAGDINVNVAGALAIDARNETGFSGLYNSVNSSAVGDGGDIIINANSVSLTNAATINTLVFGAGNSGTLEITTNTFTMNSGADINASTFGVGDAGNIRINATGNVTIDSEIGNFSSSIFSNIGSQAEGDAGDIIIDAASFSLINGAQIQTGPFAGGEGNAGDVVINVTGDVTIGRRGINNSRAVIFNNIESGVIGDAGNVTIQAGGNVTFDDGGINSSIAAGAQGNAGDITINATSLNLLKGSQLQTLIEEADGDTPGGIGNAGNVRINVTGDVTISGLNANESPSGIFNQVNEGGIGDAGNTTITGNSISIDGGFLDSRNFSDGNAGNTTLNASEIVSITNESLIRTSGNSGNISIGNPLDGDTTFTPREVSIDSSFISSGNSVVTAPEFANVEIDTGNISIYALESISVSNTQDVITSQIATSTSRLGDAGNVTLQTLDSGQITFDNTAIATGVDLVLADDGTIDLQGIGNGGTLEIITGSLNVTNDSFISASTSGIGNAGLITITAAESVSITGVPGGDRSTITNSVFNSSVGNGNDIIINTPSLFLSNGNISTATTEQGNAGNVQINASDSVTLTNGSSIFTNSFSQGDAGNINIEAGGGTVSLDDSSLATSVLSGIIQGDNLVGNGNAGDININASSISLTNGTQVNSSASGIGDAGDININAGSISLTNGTQINSSASGIGNAGEVNLNAEDTVLLDNSTISTPSLITEEIADNFAEAQETTEILALTAQENVENLQEVPVIDVPDSSDSSASENTITVISASGNTTISANSIVITNNAQIFSATPGIANAGNVEINSNSLSFTDGGQINSSTSGQGNAGDIKINVADTILIDGVSSGIFSTAGGNSTGNAGSITIDPQQVTIRNGGAISAISRGAGTGGDITIISDNLTLDNGRISTETSNADGGNIILDIADLLLLRNGNGSALISAAAGGEGNGGNITLDTTFLVAFPNENSDISANASEGNGGNIAINADGVLGIQLRETATEFSEITASSSFGISGTVTITTPETEINQETFDLPEEVVDSSDIITQSACYNFGGDSQFANSGRGGVPQIPGFIIRNDVVNVDLVDEVLLPAPPPEAIKPHHRTTVTYLNSEGEETKPAMGAVLLPNGMVEFVDYNPAEVYRDMYASAGCNKSSNE